MYYSCRLEETKRKHLFQFSIQYFKSTTNTTLKVCQLLENWCQEFLTLTETPFHPWTERDRCPPDFFTTIELSSSQPWLVHSWPRDGVSGPFHQQCFHHAPVLSMPLSPLHLVVTETRIPQLLLRYSPERLNISRWVTPWQDDCNRISQRCHSS